MMCEKLNVTKIRNSRLTKSLACMNENERNSMIEESLHARAWMSQVQRSQWARNMAIIIKNACYCKIGEITNYIEHILHTRIFSFIVCFQCRWHRENILWLTKFPLWKVSEYTAYNIDGTNLIVFSHSNEIVKTQSTKCFLFRNRFATILTWIVTDLFHFTSLTRVSHWLPPWSRRVYDHLSHVPCDSNLMKVKMIQIFSLLRFSFWSWKFSIRETNYFYYAHCKIFQFIMKKKYLPLMKVPVKTCYPSVTLCAGGFLCLFILHFDWMRKLTSKWVEKWWKVCMKIWRATNIHNVGIV